MTITRILTRMVEFAVISGAGIFLAYRLSRWANELFSEVLYALAKL